MRDSANLTIRLEAAPQDRVLEGVLEGRVDLGVMDHEPTHPRLEAEFLGREELCLVLPLDAPPPPIRFRDLDALGFVAHPDGLGYAEELFSLNFPDEFRGADHLHVRTFVNQISQIPAPVAHGIGYTLLPRSGVAAYPDGGRLRIATLPNGCHRELWIIFRRGRVLPARSLRIMHLIHSMTSRLESE
jgi:DNA-binding transcriptional LysR family regulator